MDKLRVMLVDDHAVVRGGFKVLLQTWDDVQVVAEADSGEEALRIHDSVAPDVVVMDIAMAGMGGIEAIKRLVAKHPQIRVLGDVVLRRHDGAMQALIKQDVGALRQIFPRGEGAGLLLKGLGFLGVVQVFAGPTLAGLAIGFEQGLNGQGRLTPPRNARHTNKLA